VKLNEEPVLAERLIRDAEERRLQRQPRAPGIHASDLVYCLRQKWLTRAYNLENKEPDVLSTDTLTLFLTGHAFHALLEHGDAEVETTLVLPGGHAITCTIDYIVPPDISPWEVKSTRYSSAKTPEDIANYIDQLGTYCLARRSRQGYLVILHLNGDYRENRKPVLKVWRLVFEAQELARWAIELGRRYEIVSDESQIPEADFEHYDWECQYCPYGPKIGTGVCQGGMGRVMPFFTADEEIEEVEVVEL
jgi:hypothetical protein